ncbi:mercuric transport protein [Nitrosomonas aestuarii]|nr:heavy metal-associated domain-containing protein [Nitrosomonas aestuarii]PTN07646.1 mercuric transport protein [Nitrosomonas aestuarii]
MKTTTLFLLVCCMIGIFSMPIVQAESPVPIQNNSQSVTLDVQHMTCAMCTITVRKVLQGVEGVQSAKVDFGSKTARIIFDPQKTKTETLIKATANAGYPTTVRQSE